MNEQKAAYKKELEQEKETLKAKIAKMEGEIEWAKKSISKDKRRITSIDRELPTL